MLEFLRKRDRNENGTGTKTGWDRDFAIPFFPGPVPIFSRPIWPRFLKADPVPFPVGKMIPVGHYKTHPKNGIDGMEKSKKAVVGSFIRPHQTSLKDNFIYVLVQFIIEDSKKIVPAVHRYIFFMYNPWWKLNFFALFSEFYS